LPADDLAAFMQALEIDAAHVVGMSYGALIAIAYALRWPCRVATLAEPRVHGCLDHPLDVALRERFMREVWERAAQRYSEHRPSEAMSILAEAFGARQAGAAFDADVDVRNARAMEALVLSGRPFPALDPAAVAALDIPTLVVRGEASNALHAAGAAELTRLLRRCRAAVIANSGHQFPLERPEAFIAEVLRFLDDHRERRCSSTNRG
jgi:pimeloyl-ACP methyl ester carboxylesterase